MKQFSRYFLCKVSCGFVCTATPESCQDGPDRVIQLTRLNNNALVVNCDLIKFIENTPDTVLTLTTGEKVVVQEPCAIVIEKIVDFRRKIWMGQNLGSAVAGCESCQKASPAAEHSEG